MVEQDRLSDRSVAAVIACHNRVIQTRQCLEVLYNELPRTRGVFVLDDASTDGTRAMISAQFPETRLIVGDGSNFWTKGMYKAFEQARKQGYDYYLWLNDDVELQTGFLRRMIEFSELHGEKAIAVGAVVDVKNGNQIYGGLRHVHSALSGRFEKLVLSDVPLRCHTFNGNCVLIPHSAALKVGNLDHRLFHNLGDIDYGLRAARLGIPIYQVSGSVGRARPNDIKREQLETLRHGSLKEVVDVFKSKKLVHMPSLIIFYTRHFGALGLLYAISPARYIIAATMRSFLSPPQRMR